MEKNADQEAVLATYQQLLANAQLQAVTAQVVAARQERELQDARADLAAAQQHITELEQAASTSALFTEDGPAPQPDNTEAG